MERTHRTFVLLLASLCILLAASAMVSARSTQSKVGGSRPRLASTTSSHGAHLQRATRGISHSHLKSRQQQRHSPSQKQRTNEKRFFPQEPGLPPVGDPVDTPFTLHITVDNAVVCSLERLNLEAQEPYWNTDLAYCRNRVTTLKAQSVAAFEEETASLTTLRACLTALFNPSEAGFDPVGRRVHAFDLADTKLESARGNPVEPSASLPTEMTNYISNMSVSTLVSYYTACMQDVKNLNYRIAHQEIEANNCWNEEHLELQQISNKLANIQVYTYEIASCIDTLNQKRETRNTPKTTPEEQQQQQQPQFIEVASKSVVAH